MSTLKVLLKEYEQKRIDSYNLLAKRKARLYKSVPRLQKIDDELTSISIETAKLLIGKNNKKLLSDLKSKISALQKEKESLLKKAGKPKDYLSQDYECNKCNDTGYVLINNSSFMCACLKQKLLDVEYNKSNISNLDKQTFENFNLKLYSNKVDEQKYGSNISPRENMEDIQKAALDFIKNFDNPDEKNLLFSGGTGLGKTFLSNCIVNELLKAGKTALYQTAPVMLDTLISDMFNKDNIGEGISKSLLTVDLLVIDDLGTETMNSMKFTEIYKIINTRLLNQNGKITKTIISTNLSLQDLFKTYDERLVSRFVGYYDSYHFFGDDIRFMKK